MARDNGGVIGVLNTPTSTSASGVWQLMSEYQARTTSTWPAPFNLGSSSARFNSGSSDNLTFTPSSSSNRRTFTLSAWVKRSKLGAYQEIFGASSTAYDAIGFDSNDKFRIYNYNVTPNSTIRVSTQVFRDVSAWYHIVVAYDTTNATAQSRCRIYVNGTEITAWDTNNTINQNVDLSFNQNVIQYVGRYGYSPDPEYFNGYLSEVYSINGSQLDPSSFGQTDSTTGIWIPKAYTGTYGTNVFYLNFSNASSLGTDASGNGNNFTVNNLTSADQSKDTPTNNWATWNPLNAYSATTVATLSEGNLKISGTADNGDISSTIGASAGKWYFETVCTTTTSGEPVFGVINSAGANKIKYAASLAITSGSGVWCMINLTSGGYGFQEDGVFASYPSSLLANGDILNIALDVDNRKIWYGKNGTWYNSGNPATGTNAISTNLTANETWFFFNEKRATATVTSSNFGQPSLSVSGGYSDANGYGNFTYQPPSGYLSLCTNNLASNG
jgi:hypothetical protein